MKDSVNKASVWLQNIVDNAPVAFLRRTAQNLLQNSLFNLSDFFDDLSDDELHALYYLFETLDDHNNLGKDSLPAIKMFTTLLSMASGVYYSSEKQLDDAVYILATYVVYECTIRAVMSDKQIREERKLYEVDEVLKYFKEIVK